ncbi:PAS domain-containing protein [Methylobacterium aquaticum]|uniref:PAS domain-containing protein n=1 Tax=Methylobacterium aquaticum TaxID=270351 RepID=UPI003D18762E
MDAADLPSCSDIFLRAIEDGGFVGNWSWLLTSDEQRWSLGFFRLLGLDPSIVTASYDLFISLLHPDDRERLASPHEILRGHIWPSATVRLIRPSGELRVLSVLSELRVSPEGRPLAASGVALDVTDRERLRQALIAENRRRQSLYLTTYATTYAVATNGTHEFPSEMAQVHGLALQEISQNPFVMIIPEERVGFRDRAIGSLTPHVRFQGTARERLANGEIWQFRIIGVPLWDEAGRYRGRAGIKYPVHGSGSAVHATDVPADKQIRRALEQTLRGEHLRAARGLLDWSRGTLAEASGLSLSTVRRLEEDAERLGARSRHKAVDALRRAGIRFLAMDNGILAVART